MNNAGRYIEIKNFLNNQWKKKAIDYYFIDECLYKCIIKNFKGFMICKIKNKGWEEWKLIFSDEKDIIAEENIKYLKLK